MFVWSQPEGLVNDSKSRWGPITNGDPQRSILGLILFKIFISDTMGLCTLSKSADCTQSDMADTTEGRDAILRDLEKLEKWTNENLIRFNKSRNWMIFMVPFYPSHSIL